MTTIVVITLILSTIVLYYRFTNRNIKIGGAKAADTAWEMIQQGAYVLDVRTVGEYSSDHIPGARNIPVDAISNRLQEIPRDKTVVVYCAAGGRSASARDILIRNGFKDVINAGGLKDLKAAEERFNSSK